MKCLKPNCDREVRSRGLCGSCYVTANSLVNKGKTTWKKLEMNGKCLPSKRATGEWFLEEPGHNQCLDFLKEAK